MIIRLSFEFFLGLEFFSECPKKALIKGSNQSIKGSKVITRGRVSELSITGFFLAEASKKYLTNYYFSPFIEYTLA